MSARIPKIDPDSIVKEYKIGNTRIRISNSAYINRTEEEIEDTIRRIEALATRHFGVKASIKKVSE